MDRRQLVLRWFASLHPLEREQVVLRLSESERSLLADTIGGESEEQARALRGRNRVGRYLVRKYLRGAPCCFEQVLDGSNSLLPSALTQAIKGELEQIERRLSAPPDKAIPVTLTFSALLSDLWRKYSKIFQSFRPLP